MDTCGIQRILAIQDPQETGTLLICLRPQLRYLQQLFSAYKTPVIFSVIHNIFCNGLINTGDIFQERCGCGIQIHADFIYTVFYHAI